MPNGAKITARQRRLIEALLAGQTVSQACRTAGVSRATCYRWMRLPQVQAALAEGEADLLAVAMRRLLGMTGAAADALADLVTDRRLPSARLQAAKAILDSTLRLRDAAALEARLTELERKVEAINEHQTH